MAAGSFGVQYVLYFQWIVGVDHDGAGEPHNLETDSLEAARVKASILYAGASFSEPQPNGFVIVDGEGITVYRYPEQKELH